MECPICGLTARTLSGAPADAVALQCPTHGAFSIAQTAMERFLKLDIEAREAAYQTSKVFAPQRGDEIVITALDL